MNGEIVLCFDFKRIIQKKLEFGLLFFIGLDKMEGVLILVGFIKVIILEFMSGEFLDFFMMDLSELDIQEKFLKIIYLSYSGGLVSIMVKGMDNFNDVIKSVLNKIFVNIM